MTIHKGRYMCPGCKHETEGEVVRDPGTGDVVVRCTLCGHLPIAVLKEVRS